MLDASLPLDVHVQELSASQARMSFAECTVVLTLSESGKKAVIVLEGATDKYVGSAAFGSTGEAIEPGEYFAGSKVGEPRITITSKYDRAVDHVTVALAPSS